MDKLDAIIDAKKRKVAEITAELERLHIEVGALEQAAALRPAVTLETTSQATLAVPASVTNPRRSGRQPGSISHGWRHVLARWYAGGNAWRDIADIHGEVRPDMGLAYASVRERVRRFTEEGHLERNGDKFRVTDTAAARFKLLSLSQTNSAPPVDGGAVNGSDSH
jgi:hypothetical protein